MIATAAAIRARGPSWRPHSIQLAKMPVRLGCNRRRPWLIDSVQLQRRWRRIHSPRRLTALPPPSEKNAAAARYAGAILAAAQRELVARQIADLKSKLQRVSPVEEPDEARALWGDIVAMEEGYKALGKQAAGEYE